MKITDEAVEAACIGYAQSRYNGAVAWPEHFSRDENKKIRKDMRKALEVALPHISQGAVRVNIDSQSKSESVE